MQKSAPPETPARLGAAPEATFSIVLALSFAHLLNDMMQSLLPAIYPIIKDTYGLDFGQIGLITLAFQLTASLLPPLAGLPPDRPPSREDPDGRRRGEHAVAADERRARRGDPRPADVLQERLLG